MKMEVIEIKAYYFTFGLGHPLHDRVQQIIASNIAEARAIMCEVYGTNWAFAYTQEQFKTEIQKGQFLNLKPLDPLYARRLKSESISFS